MKLKFNFKDGRYFVQDFPADETEVAETFRLLMRGKEKNGTIKTDSETLRYEDVKSVELVF